MTVITPSICDDQASSQSSVSSAERFLNRYRCPTCQIDWQDEWDCGCNDRCPQCNKEITPYASSPLATAFSTPGKKTPSDADAITSVGGHPVKRRFFVSYEIDYVHRVSVGVVAEGSEQARQLAEQAFNDATIWDDTPIMPLLSDEFHEVEDESLIWECVEVEQWPSPDHSIRQLKRDHAAMQVCRGLITAYETGEACGGSIDWRDLEALLSLALTAIDKPIHPIKSIELSQANLTDTDA